MSGAPLRRWRAAGLEFALLPRRHSRARLSGFPHRQRQRGPRAVRGAAGWARVRLRELLPAYGLAARLDTGPVSRSRETAHSLRHAWRAVPDRGWLLPGGSLRRQKPQARVDHGRVRLRLLQPRQRGLNRLRQRPLREDRPGTLLVRGDLAHELGEHGLAEGRVILHDLHEGAGATNHMLLVVAVEELVVAEDRQPVDDDTRAQPLIPPTLDGPPLAVPPSTVTITDLP